MAIGSTDLTYSRGAFHSDNKIRNYEMGQKNAVLQGVQYGRRATLRVDQSP